MSFLEDAEGDVREQRRENPPKVQAIPAMRGWEPSASSSDLVFDRESIAEALLERLHEAVVWGSLMIRHGRTTELD